MRENRTYGSEGGEVKLPYPYYPSTPFSMYMAFIMKHMRRQSVQFFGILRVIIIVSDGIQALTIRVRMVLRKWH